MSRFLSQQLQDLRAYTPGEQPRDQAYLKLNTNESPYPPAPQVVAAVTAAEVEDLRLYSDPTSRKLKEKLAGLYTVAPEQVFVGNGSDEVLNFAFLAFGGDGVAFPDISYGFYQVFGDLHRLDVQKIPLKADFTLDYRDYCALGRMVVIANPNAPTGLSIPLWQVEAICRSNPDHVVLIDEAYVDFGGESALPLLETCPNLLVVRTFSKSRCLAGGRLGYAFASAQLIGDLEKLQYSTNPYNLNRLTQRLGEASVEAEGYYQEKCAAICRTRQWTAQKLEELGFFVLPSQTNFLFARTDKLPGAQLYRELKQRGVLVRHFDDPRICEFNRITIGTPEQMAVLVDKVKEVLYENQ